MWPMRQGTMRRGGGGGGDGGGRGGTAPVRRVEVVELADVAHAAGDDEAGRGERSGRAAKVAHRLVPRRPEVRRETDPAAARADLHLREPDDGHVPPAARGRHEEGCDA